ncbi:MAG: hypothetical protein IJ870_04715 [Alphaproteobacteria bacterium]|nr:hypothetical protein [Alphaproteobacteria bacterium]
MSHDNFGLRRPKSKWSYCKTLNMPTHSPVLRADVGYIRLSLENTEPFHLLLVDEHPPAFSIKVGFLFG